MTGPELRARAAFLGDLRGRALFVVLGCLICQLGLGYGYVFGPLARDIIAEFDWTRAQYSGARAPQLFVIAALSPVVGMLTVRFGARAILIASTALIGFVFLLFSRLESLWQLYAVIMLLGLAFTGVGDITVGQLVTQWVARRRGLALGLVYTGSNLAGWLLVPLAIEVAERSSWRDALLYMGFLAFTLLVPAAIWLVRQPRAKTHPLPPVSLHADAVAPDVHADDLNLRAALRTRTFWILALSLFTFFFYFLGMLEHLVLFLTDEGMALTDATYYFSTAIGLGLVSKVVLGTIADYMHERSAILVDYGLLAISSIALLFLPHDQLIWVFLISYGFATAARDVVFPLIINHCFGERYLAEIYGGLLLALMPGGALGPIFAAAVHDATDSYDLAFTTFATANVLVVVALFFVRREHGRPRRT